MKKFSFLYDAKLAFFVMFTTDVVDCCACVLCEVAFFVLSPFPSADCRLAKKHIFSEIQIAL